MSAQGVDDDTDLLADLGGRGCTKIVRTIAATASDSPLVTLLRMLRMKWTRQRCQAAPVIVCSIAETSPRC